VKERRGGGGGGSDERVSRRPSTGVHIALKDKRRLYYTSWKESLARNTNEPPPSLSPPARSALGGHSGPLVCGQLTVNGFTDIGRGTLGSESGAGKEANPENTREETGNETHAESVSWYS